MDNREQKNNFGFQEEEAFDYKEFLGNILRYWYLFVCGIFIALVCSFFYIKYATPNYKISSKLLVEDQKNSPGGSSGTSMMADFSSLFDLPSNALNEIDILKSRSLMANVVKQMNLNVQTYKKDGLKTIELLNAPFKIVTNYKTDSLSSTLYKIEFTDKSTFHLIDDKEDVDIVGHFDVPVRLKEYDLTIVKQTAAPLISGHYLLGIRSFEDATEALMKNFDAQLSDKQSTTIDLAFNYPVAKKGELILQTLMNLYIQNNLENKVRTADSTIVFIDRRLLIVTKELNGVEKDFAEFKKQNNLANVEEQSKSLVSGASDYLNQLNAQEIQLTVISDLEKNLKDPANKRIIPSSLTDQDPVFADAVSKYNELIIEREKYNLSYKDNNPVVERLDEQIAGLKDNLIKSFEAYKKGLQISKNELVKRNSAITSKIKEVPQKERVFLDYSRQQNLKQELYLYLLQKREETAISKTSTISSTRIIDDAKSAQLPYSPKHSLIYLIGLAIGGIIPLLYISIKNSLNFRIESKQDIEKITTIPIVAEIGNNTSGDNIVVLENSRSIISEQFRSLRTNLQYLITQGKPQVIMVTSSMSGEGKTFVSVNLGSSLAITGKKVVFIELDVRKPKLSYYMGSDNSVGFTNYVVSESDDISQLLKPSVFHENLFLISSGPVPPNPSEILLSDKLGFLISKLKEQFDFIIIDSAPVGLVSDALVIEKYVDINLYVVRQDYTFKNSLHNLNNIVNDNKLKRAYLVVNDIKTKKGGYYGYGYGYGSYGYGYGNYGQEAENPTMLQGIKDIFKKS